MLRRAFRCCLLLLGVLPFAAQASPSPEFHQLLLEINGRLENLAPVITRGPECASNVVERAKEALQGNVATTALTKVVVEPLEAGAKVAAGALGIPAAAISTYSLVRCGMNESTAEGFAACVGGELAGYAGGKALEKAGVGNLEGAIAGLAWDKAYGAVRGAIEDYARKSESVEWTARGSCQTKLSAYWNRRPRPEARGGVIVVHAQFAQCECRTRKQATAGSLRFVVPVHYTPAGNSQPGWSTGTPKQYLVEAQCCGQRKWDEQTYQYDESGEWVNKSRDDAPAKPQPPRTDSPAVRDTGSAADPWPPRPSKPARLPPPKPEPVWSVENPCPVCEPFKELMEVHLSAAQDEESKAASLEGELAKNAAEQEAARARIAQLQEQLRMLEGQGGSAYDPATGLTTTAVTQADGTVLITVTDKQGREIERRTRDRRDSAQIRGRIADEEASLDALQRAAEQLQKDLAYQRALAAKQRKLADDELRALKHCLVEQCNQDPARIFDRTALVVPAETGVQTGRAPGGEAKPKKDILPEIEPDAHLKDHAPDAGSGDAAQPKEDILSEIEPDQAVPDRVPGAEVKPKEDILAEIEPVTAADNTGKAGAATGTPAAGAAADAPVAAGVGTAGKAATEAVSAGGQGDARMHDAVRDGSSGSVSSREAVAGEGAPGKAYAAEPPLDSRWRLETQHKFEGDSRTTPAGEAAQPVTAVPAGAPDAGGAMRTDAAPGMSPATGTGMSVPGETPATAQDDPVRIATDALWHPADLALPLEHADDPVRIATDALWLRPYCPECEEEARAFVEARQAYDELKSVPKELQGEQWAQRMQAAEERLKKAALDYDDCLDEAMCGTPEGLRRQNPCPQCDREWERIARAPTPIEMFKRREEWLECFRQHCPEPLPDRRTSIRSPVPGGAEAVAAAPAQPAQVQCGFPPVQPVVIGPKEEFGNSAEQKALKAGKAVFGIVGGLLGSRGGGGGGGGGFGMPGGFSSGNSGPNLTSNPLRSIMQRFERPDAETAIKAAAKYMDDGKLLISAEVDDSPDDGVVHMVEVQRLVPKADGSGCDTQVQRPGRWLHYAIHEKWWAKLRIQTFVSDGSGWVKTSDTGWMDWGSGTNVLETGKIPANEIPNTGWGSMGADRAMGGPRAAGAYFDPGKPAAYGVPVPERYVVHISRPESDPVTTTPFVFYPVHFADGTVKLSDQEPEQPFIFPGPSPKLPIGGGMTQIDPPHTPETGEDIMEEIDHVPVIAH